MNTRSKLMMAVASAAAGAAGVAALGLGVFSGPGRHAPHLPHRPAAATPARGNASSQANGPLLAGQPRIPAPSSSATPATGAARQQSRASAASARGADHAPTPVAPLGGNASVPSPPPNSTALHRPPVIADPNVSPADLEAAAATAQYPTPARARGQVVDIENGVVVNQRQLPVGRR